MKTGKNQGSLFSEQMLFAETFIGMLFCLGASRSMCDENEMSMRGRILSDGNLNDLFPFESARQLPLVYHIDDWHLYDNNDSFDDDIGDASQASVTLTSHVHHDWTDDDDFAAFVSMARLDWSDDGEVDDDSSPTGEQGFYDVTMLSGGVFSEVQLSSCLTDDDTELLLHPDLKLEYIMATHHRQRRIAEQLLASDSANETAAAAVTEDEDKQHRLSREISFVAGCPQLSKVKPDDFWIREVVDGLPSDSDEAKCISQQCSCESISVCSCGSSSTAADGKIQQNSTGNSVRSSPTSLSSPGKKVIDIAQQLTQEDCNSDKLADPETKSVHPLLSIYETEGINFEPGLVRRTVDLGVDVSASAVKTIASRPVSIYETEEISLEPGLVRRTRQEYEQRER